jgi:hypothetical protein
MRKGWLSSLWAISALSVSSCTFLFAPLPDTAATDPSVQHVPYTGSFTYTVDPGASPHDVYFVFTNPSTTADAWEKPTVTSDTITVDGSSLPAPVPLPLPSYNTAPRSLADRIAEFNRNPRSYLRGLAGNRPLAALISGSPAQNDVAGVTSADIVTDIDGSGAPLTQVPSTCRLVTGPMAFADGRQRTLSIWVQNSEWGAGIYPITPAMVQALADRFLKSPENLDDLYHLDTGVVGEPWGSTSGSQYDGQLISWDTNNTITIFLGRLNSSYSGSVVVGYYWAKDNFTIAALPGSNQRIMFYIDSVLFSDFGSSTWAPTDYWPGIVFSTLGHEFQHMIHFYQKQVVQDAADGTDTWINEMCSQILEDLVADKLGVDGPRGVTDADGSAGPPNNTAGRLPSFNQYSYLGLVQKSGFTLADYSTAYAFGAWLARNYGGAGLLKKIVQCPETDETAILNAVTSAETGRPAESMTRLLEKWAAAVLISDTTSAPAGYRYNTGGWTTSTSGGISYRLGSINIFNYSPSLYVFKNSGSVPTSTFRHSSNVYYQAATDLTESRTWSISIPDGIVMSVVLK